MLTAAGHTHSHRAERGSYVPNPGYVDPTLTLERWSQLSPTPARVGLTYTVREASELALLRSVVRDWAARAGLDGDQITDLVLAIDAAATPALMHETSATLRGWTDQHSVLCEVTDNLAVPDLFAGRLPPPAETRRGRGMWLINQACDLVEHRSYPHGTVVRMHLDHPGTAAVG